LRNPLKNFLPHFSQDAGVNDKQIPNAMKVEKQIKVLIIFRIFFPKYLTLRVEKRKNRVQN
jgi:hypothetical protein